MKDSEIVGIYIPNKKTFYYYENGQHTPGQTGIDRLRGVLISRGLIDLTDQTRKRHLVMTLAEAKLEGHAVDVIYMNRHIEKQMANQRQVKDIGTLWD